MKTIENQRIVDDAARETLGNTLAKRATFATTKAPGNRAKNQPICPSNPPGRSTNRVNAAMPVNTKAMIPARFQSGSLTAIVYTRKHSVQASKNH
jgi:hypothetical protein